MTNIFRGQWEIRRYRLPVIFMQNMYNGLISGISSIIRLFPVLILVVLLSQLCDSDNLTFQSKVDKRSQIPRSFAIKI